MAVVNELVMELRGPGMTFLHRAGLAGLLMTLENIENEPAARQAIEKAGGKWSWSNTPTSVTLRWTAQAGPFLKALLNESFKVDKNGLIWFRGIGHPSTHLRSAISLHSGVLGTFLQHAKSRKVQSKGESSLLLDMDGIPYPYRYLKLESYKHQDVPLPLDGGVAALAGWQYPGGAVRHSGHGDKLTALEEPLERFLPLLFAPVGAIYFIAHRTGEGVRPQYAIVFPDVPDLQTYLEARRLFLTDWGIQDFYIAGSEEAAFRVMATLEAHRMLGRLGSSSCHVVSFGTVPWSSQQKTRVEVFTIKMTQKDCIAPYQTCRSQPDLLPHIVQPEGKQLFIDVPQSPSLIATNLANGRPWWSGFSAFIADRKRREHVIKFEQGTSQYYGEVLSTWEHVIKFEQSGLSYMVESAVTMPDSAERVFVKACHEAWRNRLGMLGEDARNRGVPFSKVHDRERERTRMAFAHCKDQNTFRETITGFWARSGPLESLKERWGEILPFLGSQWQEGRDLALLALASYRGQAQDLTESVEESR